MNGHEFLLMVGSDLNRIRNFFRKGLEKYQVAFDEDIFSDTMLKCVEKLNEKCIDADMAMHYFWISFKNNTLKAKEKSTNRVDDIDDACVTSIIDEPYDERKYILYDIIIDEVENEFGPELSNLWKQHILHDKSYEELQKITEIKNLHYCFRKIREFVRIKLPTLNKEFKEIKREIF